METGSWQEVRRRSVRFILRFLLLVFSAHLLLELSWVQKAMLLPCVELIASLGGKVSQLFSDAVTVSGTTIRDTSFAVDIRRGCDGVAATTILVSACLAGPRECIREQRRLWGETPPAHVEAARSISAAVESRPSELSEALYSE